MFRRRAFRGKGGRRYREPRNWDRPPDATVVDTSGVFSQLITQVLFDPTLVVAGNQDLRLTLVALRFSFVHKLVFTAGAIVPLVLEYGVYVADVGEPARDPSFVAAADAHTDWMWHASSLIFPGTAAVTVANGTGINTMNGNDVARIGVKRKLSQDEQVVLVAKVFRADPAADAAPTISRQTLFASRSALYQRTSR